MLPSDGSVSVPERVFVVYPSPVDVTRQYVTLKLTESVFLPKEVSVDERIEKRGLEVVGDDVHSGNWVTVFVDAPRDERL